MWSSPGFGHGSGIGGPGGDGLRQLGLVSGNLTVGNPLRISVHGPIPAGAPLAVPIEMFDPPTPDDYVHFLHQGVVLTSGACLVKEPQHTVVLYPPP